ncbi:MAG: hypothetical protein GY765_34430 [bacterium]|nr:hypothetical protein [bacterium]
MKKSNLTKKLSLNKMTIAGLNNTNKAGVLGGAHTIRLGNCPVTTNRPDSQRATCVTACGNTCDGGTCYNTCPPGCGSIYPVTSEPTDPTYTC